MNVGIATLLAKPRTRRGASTFEYILIVGLVALVALVGLRAMGSSVTAKITCQIATLFGSEGAACGPGSERAARSTSPGAGGTGNPALPEGTGAKFEPVAGQPFVQGDGDSSKAHPSDITQGALNDCYVLSSFAAIAYRDPKFLEGMIQQNKDGTYTVRFRQPNDHPFWQFWESSTKDVKVTVTAEFPMKDGKPVFAQLGDSKDGTQELWPLIVEKAYAQYKGGYTAFANGGVPAKVLADITGKEGHFLLNDSIEFSDVYDRWKSGDAIVANTRAPDSVKTNPLFGVDSPLKEPLVAWHIYYVTNVDNDKKTITLRNPWGWEHPEVTLTWEQYKAAYEVTQTNSTR